MGTLWRSAHTFGASFIFTIGTRYKHQASDTVKTWSAIPLFEYKSWRDFEETRPFNCVIVGVEQSEKSRNINTFSHFKRSIYVLGSEDNGLPLNIQDRCNSIIHIDSSMCLNVAVAGSIVMYDRRNKCAYVHK